MPTKYWIDKIHRYQFIKKRLSVNKKTRVLFSFYDISLFHGRKWYVTSVSKKKLVPSLVRADISGEEDKTCERGLFCLCTGSVLIAGGMRAGSIFQGDTLSGRGMEEVSSQSTCNSMQIFLALVVE